MQLKEFRMSLLKDNNKDIQINLEKGTIIINLLREDAVSDFVDIDLIRDTLKEVRQPSKDSHNLLIISPIQIRYQGDTLLEIFPDGTKRLHPSAAAHFGLKILLQKISDII